MVWISKSLGHGIRIGTSIRLTPTQRELKLAQDNEFLKRLNARLSKCMLSILQENGYYVLSLKDIVDKIPDERKAYGDYYEDLQEYNRTIRMLIDGASLTEKRKEKLLDIIYNIEEKIPAETFISKKEITISLNSIGMCISLFFLILSSIGMLSFFIYCISNFSLRWLTYFLISIFASVWLLFIIKRLYLKRKKDLEELINNGTVFLSSQPWEIPLEFVGMVVFTLIMIVTILIY